MPRRPRWPDHTAYLSHEVRTHLQGILGFVDWLRASRLSDAQHTALRRLEAGGQSLLELVNSLLEPASSNPRDFVPAEITEDVAALLALPAQQRGVEVICAADPDRQAVHGDSTAFRKIAMNLVSNAVKFTERGHIVIRLEAKPSGASVQLRLSVCDTGIGIAPANRRRVFTPRFQVHADKIGSGLGLPLARSLARMMGGDIRLSNRKGGGSIFLATLRLPRANTAKTMPPRTRPCVIVGGHPEQRRWLAQTLLRWGVPCAESELDRVNVTAEALRRSTGESPLLLIDLPANSPRLTDRLPESILLHPLHIEPGRCRALAKPLRLTDLLAQLAPSPTRHTARASTQTGHRILLVDDDPVGRTVAARQLMRRGHRVSTVGDGVQAVRRLRSGTWDLAILDLDLSDTDGVELAHRLRLHAPDIPLLALTGHAGTEARARCLRAGFAAHLTKPAKETAFIQKAEQLAEQGAANNADRARARRILLRSADEECARLDQAAQSGEATAISRAAHRSRGALAAAGLVRLAELAAQAERRAEEGCRAQAAAKLRQVSGGLRRLAGDLTSK